MKTPQNTAPVPQQIIARMAPHVYAQLEKAVGGIGVGPSTTDLQAGYMLGVQAVLKTLREGFVVDAA